MGAIEVMCTPSGHLHCGIWIHTEPRKHLIICCQGIGKKL
jgi:hypothetical protein